MSAVDQQQQMKFTLARDQILTWIREGRVPAGGKLPSERELARLLCIDQRTVRRGLKDLVASGTIVKRPRVGNFIRETKPAEMVTQVALALPDWMLHNAPHHPVPTLIQQGINRVLGSEEYSLSFYWYGHDRLWEDVGANIVTRGVRGALIYPQNTQAARDIKRICDAGVHVACLEYSPVLDMYADVFSVDTGANTSAYGLYRRLLEGMIQRGHRNVLAAAYTPSTETDKIRRDLAELAAQYDLPNGDYLLLEIPSDGYTWDGRAMMRALDRDPRPTGIVVADEYVAADLFRACYDRRIHVPDELSVAAVFNMAPHLHPVPVTSPDGVFLRSYASELAAGHLVKALRGERPVVTRLTLKVDIRWTASVKIIDSAVPTHP